MKKIYSYFCALLFVLGMMSQVFAVGLNDEELHLKGYNSETIRIVNLQKARMEEQPTPPTMSKTKRFFKNIWKNEWTESLQEFGYSDPTR